MSKMIKMNFYEDFAAKYDDLVSLENRFKRESNFFQTVFSKNKVKTILDCACGTGHHLLMLKQLGYEIKGSDLSPKMIEKAKENLTKFGEQAVIEVSDFKNLNSVFQEKFDAIICVGNSLPHVSNEEDLKTTINGMYALLNRNGMLIIEQRNFDFLIKKQERFFPVTFKEDEVFFYVLDYFPNKIVFNVIDLEIKARTFHVYSTDYYPLLLEQLEKVLKTTGFRDSSYFGDYDFHKFDKTTSRNVILICRK